MSRNGLGVYSVPAGTAATTITPLNSAAYNLFLADLTADLNAARPIVAGGTGATTAAAALVNLGITATAAELNALDGVTASAAELNILDGATLTVTELNYVDGVTSAIQTQLDGKQASGATLTSLEALALVAGDTIYATAADTLARLAKGTAGQGLVMNAGATAPEWGVPTMAPGYQSADLASTSAATHSLTHGLGARPNLVQIWLKCLTTEYNYAVGDWYGPIGAETFADGSNKGIGVAVTATNIKVVVGSNGITILNAATGGRSTITPANWAIVVRAWK